MANKTPEKDLVDKFKNLIGYDVEFSIKHEINFNCKSKNCADIEYLSNSDRYFVIEAKSHHSSDGHNSVHKIFGELLKETGRSRGDKEITYGILIPKDYYNKKDGIGFYRKGFNEINRKKYIGFGKLIPISYIFVCSQKLSSIDVYTWESFYDGKNPIRTITPNKANAVDAKSRAAD